MRIDRQTFRAGVFGIAIAALVSGTAYAQGEPIDVTLEVLDDVSEIDAVVMRLEDARAEGENRDRAAEEARQRDALERSVRDAAVERERRAEDAATERDSRRELQNEEEDLEVDLERGPRMPETDAPTDARP